MAKKNRVAVLDDEERYEVAPKGVLCARGMSEREADDIFNSLLKHALAQNPDDDGVPAILFDGGHWTFAKVEKCTE